MNAMHRVVSRIKVQMLAIGVVCAFLAAANSGHCQVAECRIEVRLPDAQFGDSIFFTEFYGDNQFALDTVRYQGGGRVSFACPPANQPGRYSVVLQEDKNVDFLFAGSPVSMTIRSGPLPASVTIEEGEDAKLMYDYMKFMDDMREKRAPFDAILSSESTSPEEKNDAEESIIALGTEVLAQQDVIMVEHPASLMSVYLKMVNEVEYPEVPDGVLNPEVWATEEYRRRFWERVDFSNPAVVRDPIITMLLDYYFQSVLPAIPGLVHSEATGLIARAKDVSVKQYLIEYFILEYVNPSVSCMDEVFVKIFDYHDSLDDLEWMPAENRREFRQLSDALKPNLCGANLPDLTLQSPSGDWQSLSDMDHDFRLVVIWDSECEHCVEQMEALNVMQDLLASLDVGVYAVGYDFHPEGWRDVIRQHAWDFAWHVSDVPAMQDQAVRDSLLLNGLTNQESLGFREYLDIRTTPKLYLLDANNKILSKGMGAEAVPDLVRARAQGSGR